MKSDSATEQTATNGNGSHEPLLRRGLLLGRPAQIQVRL